MLPQNSIQKTFGVKWRAEVQRTATTSIDVGKKREHLVASLSANFHLEDSISPTDESHGDTCSIN